MTGRSDPPSAPGTAGAGPGAEGEGRWPTSQGLTTRELIEVGEVHAAKINLRAAKRRLLQAELDLRYTQECLRLWREGRWWRPRRADYIVKDYMI